MIALLLAAAAPVLALDYQAPAGCPAAAELFAEVQRLRGPLIAGDVDPDVRARVRVREVGSGWVAEVETSGGGRRALEADTCQRAVEAAAVVLSLALANPRAPAEPAPAAPEPAPAPPVPPPPPPPARVAPFVGVTGGARFGVLASPVAAALLTGGVEWRWLRVEARVGLGAPSLVRGAGAAANVDSWFHAGLTGCGAVVDAAAARLELCAMADAALLTAQGTAVPTPSQGSALWLGLFGGAAALSPIWRGLSAVLDGGVGVALARPRFFVERGGTLFEAPVLVGRLGLGLQWKF